MAGRLRSVRGPHGALDVRRAVRSVASATGVAPAATAAARALSTSSQVLTVQASVMPDHPVGAGLPGAPEDIIKVTIGCVLHVILFALPAHDLMPGAIPGP
jgi:hypothetical protein